MDAIKYLKLDLRIMKEKKQYAFLVFIPIFICIMLNYTEMGVTCFLIFSMVCISLPFANENAGKFDNMYTSLPCKTSSMVLGRFVCLNIITIITIFACLGGGLYYFSNNNDVLTIGEMIFSVSLSIVFNFLSCPLCYKAKFEKGNMMNTVVISFISILMFFAIALIPMEIEMTNSLYTNQLNYIVNYVLNNSKAFITVDILVILAIDYISYIISCRICKGNEV